MHDAVSRPPYDERKAGVPLSIVAPILNEANRLPQWLQHLAPLRDAGVEVIIVDGGSRDNSVEVARQSGVAVYVSSPGRARQMNTGAARARGEVLLFLHADTWLPPDATQCMASMRARGRLWGRFDVCIQGRSWMLRVVAFMMNGRSRVTGIATGDQAMFVTRALFEAVGGFPEQPLMEDIALSKSLLNHTPPLCVTVPVRTSGRRWEEKGVWRTIFLMWRLRWAYWRGMSADILAEAYR